MARLPPPPPIWHSLNEPSKKKVRCAIEKRGALLNSFISAAQIDEAHAQLAQHQSKIGQLEAGLAAREQELQASDARYRKSVEKAKEIIKCYDPKSMLTGKNEIIFIISLKLIFFGSGNSVEL